MKWWALLLVCWFVAGCDLFQEESKWKVFPFDLDSLAAIPETAQIEGRSYKIDVNLDRNYMPRIPRNYDPPLTAVVSIQPCDTLPKTSSFTATGGWIWFIKDSLVSTNCTLMTHDRESSSLSYVAYDGPHWAVGKKIDVIAELTFVSDTSLMEHHLKIRKEDVEILGTH